MIAPPVLIQNSWLVDRGCIGWLATHVGHMPESFGHVLLRYLLYQGPPPLCKAWTEKTLLEHA